MPQGSPEIKNRKAFHDYHIEDRLEAGIVLSGTEVKSVREGRVSMRDAYVDFSDENPTLVGLSIAHYENRGYTDHGVFRPRRLLMHNREIKQWARQVADKGFTAIPLRVYFNDRGYAKVEIGLARGKRQYDKRQTLAAKDAQREIERAKKEMQRWNR